MNQFFLLDLPETKENDAIGYDVYVDSVINALNSDARMIGLISNYGSGKSTVINMVKNKMNYESQDVIFISINLWKIKEDKKTKNNNTEDNTLDIHKFLLRTLIQYLPEESDKDYFRKRIDDNYALFNISMKNKNDILALYLLLAFFFFNVLMKIEIVNFSVPRICIFMLDLVICIGFACILSRSKLYLSFNKDSSKRKINESDTIECFNEIINNLNKNCTDVVINIEDLDRYNDSKTVIRVLEQIYKFYIENKKDIKVKFIVSLKSPYSLINDYIQYSKIENINLIEKTKEYKELYEKLFDLIINLQTVSYQNYGVVLLRLLNSKKELLNSIGLKLPKDEENMGFWNYLYKGNNVTVRDIKHRYNYFITIYNNLYEHKESLENKELISISIETCLFISYLEDEYSTYFYKLIDNSLEFSKLVSTYIFTKKVDMKIEDYSTKFINEITMAFERGLIKEDYSMYFYKYPKNKPINNIFDAAIQNAIHTDNIKSVPDLKNYCERADTNLIKKSIQQKYKESGIPEIIFKNDILFNETYKIYKKEMLDYLTEKYTFSCENGLKMVQKKLNEICNLGEKSLLLKKEYINILAQDLENNYEQEKIIEYRIEIIKITGLIQELKSLYSDNMPLITTSELDNTMSSTNILYLINENNIDETINEVIEFVAGYKKIPFTTLISFFDKITIIDKELFKQIFYSFNFYSYTKNDRYLLFSRRYNSLELEKIKELEKLVQKTKLLPVYYEANIVRVLNRLSGEEKKQNEQLYINMIKTIGNISSVFKKYIAKCNTYYVYSYEVEECLYQNKFYRLYVYSKTNRQKVLSYEKDKFENLKEHILYYFKNSMNLNDKYRIDKDIIKYIKQNISYKELIFKKICLLLSLPQTLEDFLNVYYKKYQNPDDNNELSIYLNKITCFESKSENAIIDYLINEIKSKNLVLTIATYNHIRSILSKNGNIRRFQHIKKLCSND